MTTDFEFFSTHSDGIFYPRFEIERETLGDHFQDTSILEVDAVLTHVEGSVHIILCHLDSRDDDDTRTTGDLDMNS